MYDRLLDVVRERIRNGELSERGLARLTGISQPHLHNVLKGRRLLSNELVDEVLRELHIGAQELIAAARADPIPYRSVPLMTDDLGAGTAPFDARRTSGMAFVPAELVLRTKNPLAIRLGVDPSAAPKFEPGDLVLVDQSETSRNKIEDRAVYLTAASQGPRLRYVRVDEGPDLFLASQQSLAAPGEWEAVTLGPAGVAGVVLGRVVWVSRQMEQITDYC